MAFLNKKCSRRSFCKTGLIFGIATIFPQKAFSNVVSLSSQEKSLAIYNIHTGESFEGVYWNKGKYITEQLINIDNAMRDHRTNDIKHIDTELLDLLFDIKTNLNIKHAFHLISGYRSPKTNAMLHKHSNGVAKNSLHIEGRAADIFIPKIKLSTLHRTAVRIKEGGVGYYPGSNFVHVDTGKVRYW